MKNIEKCECIIGIRYDYENTDLVNLVDLKEHIEKMKRLPSYFHNKPYELADYSDKRKSTDLTQFDECPLCGKKNDLKAIKGGANG